MNCKFELRTGYAYGYNCRVEKSMKTNQKNIVIEKVTGTHKKFSSNNDVAVLYFGNNPNMKFIPVGYSNYFTIENFWVYNCPIESITASNFENPANIKTLGIMLTPLKEFGEEVFSQLENLNFLYLGSNQLIKISENIFSKLVSLQKVVLSNNKLTYLPANLFANNKNLKEVEINQNKLMIVDNSKMFSGMAQLVKVQLLSNLCINKVYPTLGTIEALETLLQSDCSNPVAEKMNELRRSKEVDEQLIIKLEKENIEEKQKLKALTEKLEEKNIEEKKFMALNKTWEQKNIEENQKIDDLSEKLEQMNIETSKLKDKIQLVEREKKKLQIEKSELKEELNILTANHTEAQEKIEEMINNTIDLEIRTLNMTLDLAEALDEKEKLSSEIKSFEDKLDWFEFNYTLVSEENSQLRENLIELEGNLTQNLLELEGNMTQIFTLEEKVEGLYANNSKLMSQIEHSKRVISELKETFAKQAMELDEADSTFSFSRVETIICIVLLIVILIFISLQIKSSFGGTKKRMYKASELEVVFGKENVEHDE